MRQHLQLFQKMEAPLPVAAMVSLLNVRNIRMRTDNPFFFSDSGIERDDVLLPAVLIEGVDDDLSLRMKPAFDSLWNAAGYPRSANYTAAGQWRGLSYE